MKDVVICGSVGLAVAVVTVMAAMLPEHATQATTAPLLIFLLAAGIGVLYAFLYVVARCMREFSGR